VLQLELGLLQVGALTLLVGAQRQVAIELAEAIFEARVLDAQVLKSGLDVSSALHPQPPSPSLL
jgi:hypothetical protein